MITEDIKAYLKEAIKDNMVVLVEGPWGCGKTYAINQFIKSKSLKKTKYIYESLFGIRKLEEINDDIYKKSHRILNLAQIVWKIIVFIFGLFGASLDTKLFNKDVSLNIDLSLKSGNNKNVKKVKSKYVVVIDDLERCNFEKNKIADVLGFIEHLVFNKYKVIIVCFEEMIKNKNKEKFLEFKEKVIDREYHILEADNEVIKGFFPNIHFDISSYYCEFGNNYRLCKKANDLYIIIITKGLDINNDLYKYYSQEVIFEYCVNIIVGLYTDKYIKFLDSYLNTKSEDDFAKALTCKEYNEEWINQDYSKRIDAILFYNNVLDQTLIINIIDYYLHNNMNSLRKSFDIKDSILTANYYLLSDDEIESISKKQIETILNEKEENPHLVFKCICIMINWEPLTNVSKYLPKINEHLLNNFIRYYDVVMEETYSFFDAKEEIKEYINKLKKEFAKIDIKNKVENLNLNYKNGNYNECADILYDIKNNYSLRNDTNFKSYFLENARLYNFYIDLLVGHLPNDSYRKMFFELIDVFNNLGLKVELEKYADYLVSANQNNKVLNMRIKSYIKNKP